MGRTKLKPTLEEPLIFFKKNQIGIGGSFKNEKPYNIGVHLEPTKCIPLSFLLLDHEQKT
jgi:hypothetical protein